MDSVYEKDSFSGDSAHPVWLKRAGIMSGLVAVLTITLGVADILMASLSGEATSSTMYYIPINFVYVAAAIWGSIPALLTGLLAVYTIKNKDGSKLKLSLGSFISSLVFLPTLIAITAVEIKQMRDAAQYDPTRLPQRYGIVVAILIMGCINFLVNLSIMVIVCFCTYALEEDESPILPAPTITTSFYNTTYPTAVPTTNNFVPTNVVQTYPKTETTYKVVQLQPNNFTTLPLPANQIVTNLPYGYQNLGFKLYNK